MTTFHDPPKQDDPELDGTYNRERNRLVALTGICPFCKGKITPEETYTQNGLKLGSSCCWVSMEILDNLDVFQALPPNLQQIALKRARDELTYLVRFHAEQRSKPAEPTAPWIDEFMAKMDRKLARNKSAPH